MTAALARREFSRRGRAVAQQGLPRTAKPAIGETP